MMDGELAALYREGVRLFNAREFYACHDVLEELWTDTIGPERPFYQGLIQSAVALFHFENGNLGGARRMYLSASRYLDPYRPRYLGLDLERFLAQLRHCFEELMAAGDVYPAYVALREERIPRLALDDAVVSE